MAGRPTLDDKNGTMRMMFLEAIPVIRMMMKRKERKHVIMMHGEGMIVGVRDINHVQVLHISRGFLSIES